MGFFSSAYFGGGVSSAATASAVDTESIYAVVGEPKTVAITCNQDIDALPLEAVLESLDKTDVSTFADGDISKEDAVATLTLPAVAAEKTLRLSIRTTSGVLVASRLVFVTYEAQGD